MVCYELRIAPQSVGSARSVAAAVRSFANGACGDPMLGPIVARIPLVGHCHPTRSELLIKLKRLVSRSVASAKLMEQPPAAANPTRLHRWLETSAAHISIVFSPLKERGPPRS